MSSNFITHSKTYKMGPELHLGPLPVHSPSTLGQLPVRISNLKIKFQVFTNVQKSNAYNTTINQVQN